MVGLVLGALAGALSSAVAPSRAEEEEYQVNQIVVASPAAAQLGLLRQDALRVTRGEVARRAGEQLGLEPDYAAMLVSVSSDTDSASIMISSTDADPEVAAEQVEAFVGAFLDVVNEDLQAEQARRLDQLRTDIAGAREELQSFDALVGDQAGANPFLQQQRAALDTRLSSLEEELRLEQLNAATELPYSTLGPDLPVPVDSDLLPVPDGIVFRSGLLGVFGLVLAAGLVMLLERVKPRIDTRDELVAALELPVLAEVGRFGRRKMPQNADGSLRLDGVWAEAYRRIRSAIQFVQSTADDAPVPRSFMFASPSPSAGKSTTTAVTALALAEAGQRTLVIGGDFRRPTVHAMLGAPSRPGVRERALLDVDRPSIEDVVHPAGRRDLFVTPSGEPGREVVGMAKVAREVIEAAVSHGATVLVDTTPVEVANDVVDLLPAVDEVIIVVRSGRTTASSLRRSVEQLRQHGAHLMGMVLIGTPGLARQQYYYEGYYSTDARRDDDSSSWVAAAAVDDPSVDGEASGAFSNRADEPRDDARGAELVGCDSGDSRRRSEAPTPEPASAGSGATDDRESARSAGSSTRVGQGARSPFRWLSRPSSDSST